LLNLVLDDTTEYLRGNVQSKWFKCALKVV